MAGDGEVNVARQKCRLVLVYHILHIIATDFEFARCTHNDAHIGNLIVVEKYLWKRIYITTRTADVLIIGHLLFQRIYAVNVVFHYLYSLSKAKLLTFYQKRKAIKRKYEQLVIFYEYAYAMINT